MDRLIMTAIVVIFTLSVGVKAGKMMVESTERAQARMECAMLKAGGKPCTTRE